MVQPDEYKYLTVEEQDKILEAGDRYGSLTQLFYLDNYVCDSENESKPRLNGSVDKVRCCKGENSSTIKIFKILLKYYVTINMKSYYSINGKDLLDNYYEINIIENFEIFKGQKEIKDLEDIQVVEVCKVLMEKEDIRV